jgi:hypothetical protein
MYAEIKKNILKTTTYSKCNRNKEDIMEGKNGI